MSILKTLFFCLFSMALSAQGPTNTNIYLFDLGVNAQRNYEVTNPRFLTNFNKYGYNNQPTFLKNDLMMITVQFPSEKQTDLYKLDLRNKIKTRFTATAESEYSPQLMPGVVGQPKQISCVRVSADGNAIQNLWQYPYDQSGDGNVMVPTINPIGYYAWSSINKLAAFIVGEPHSLVSVDRRNDETVAVTERIGRCLQAFSNGDVAFVHKVNDRTWLLKRLNMATFQPELITAIPVGVEDFVILTNGTIIMGNGSQLFKFNRLIDVEWKAFQDLSKFGIKKITRMAVSPHNGRIAIVSEK